MVSGSITIGVLAAQGAFVEHIGVLRELGIVGRAVRLPGDLDGLDGLIIPGGESTAISKLMLAYDLTARIQTMARQGMAVLGTCAGMILLARRISDADGVVGLGLMDITVRRNAFGRQVDSFETNLCVPALGEAPFPAVFIRAPVIEEVTGSAEVLARLENGAIVAVRQGKCLALAFHPELTTDTRFHRYFLDLVAERKS